MYRVRLDDFEGPLDLLLFLVRRDELDIFDIPIASIAREYLEYIQQAAELDLDRVGDYLFAAAMLIGIKAQMLLPQPEVEEGEELEDPRLELVERLLEYERYKVAAGAMSTMWSGRMELFTRGTASAPRHEELQPERFSNTSEDALLSALRSVLAQTRETPTVRVRGREITIEEQRAYIMAALGSVADSRFSELVAGRGRPFVVATFLAALEMAFQGVIVFQLSDSTDDFRIQRLEQEMK